MREHPGLPRGKHPAAGGPASRRAAATDPGATSTAGSSTRSRRCRSSGDRRLRRRQGRRPAQGDRQEEPRGDGQASSPGPRGCRTSGAERVGADMAVDHPTTGSADYCVNESPLRLLCADSLPDGLAEGQPSPSSSRRSISSVMDSEDRCRSSSPGRADGGRRSCPPTSTCRPRLRGRRREHPLGLDAVEGVGPGGGGDQKRQEDRFRGHPGPRPPAVRSPASSFCERVDNHAVDEKAIEALIVHAFG